MVKCGPARMRVCSLGLLGLGFRVRDRVRVSVRDKVGVRVSDGVRVSTFYFSSHQQPTEARIPAGPHFTHSLRRKRLFCMHSYLSFVTPRIS